MSEEQKQYAEKHGISLSKLVQNEIDKRRKRTGDQRTRLKKEIAQVQAKIESLDEYKQAKEAELQQLEDELDALAEAEDERITEMIAICEVMITGDENVPLRNSTISRTEAEDCFDACVDREGLETTDEIIEMLEAHGFSEEYLNPIKVHEDSPVSEQSHEEAKRLVRTSLTSEEKERIEDWVGANL